ncbi:hypothetical protein GZE03_002696 [Shigella sonnei]|nr:hypothetical protein [Shigella sonnei]
MPELSARLQKTNLTDNVWGCSQIDASFWLFVKYENVWLFLSRYLFAAKYQK